MLTDQSSFIDTVGNVGTREAWCQSRKPTLQELQVLVGNDLLQVHTKDLPSAIHGGLVDVDMPVETTRSHESLVQDIWSVSTCQYNDLLSSVETIHLSQDLVQSSLALVIATTKVLLLTSTADGVDLINEDDARGALAGIGE